MEEMARSGDGELVQVELGTEARIFIEEHLSLLHHPSYRSWTNRPDRVGPTCTGVIEHACVAAWVVAS